MNSYIRKVIQIVWIEEAGWREKAVSKFAGADEIPSPSLEMEHFRDGLRLRCAWNSSYGDVTIWENRVEGLDDLEFKKHDDGLIGKNSRDLSVQVKIQEI